MAMDYVSLVFPPYQGWVLLREICGFDEQAIDAVDTANAIQLLDRLFVPQEGSTLSSGMSRLLPTASRDRLLAHVYTRTYRSRVEGTLTCDVCVQPFDMDFQIPHFLSSLQQDKKSGTLDATEHGYYIFQNDIRFRLPTGDDELAVGHLLPDKAQQMLLDRCVQKDEDISIATGEIQAAMQAVAPMLDIELDTQCPECGNNQSIHFDIQSYLLRMLQSEQHRLSQEVHRLARAYHWSLHDILSLPRRQRKAYVALIETELSRSTYPRR